MTAQEMIRFLSDLIDEQGMPLLIGKELCEAIQQIALAESLAAVGDEDEA